jgi:nicotinate-nucleotide adenylyltransferase
MQRFGIFGGTFDPIHIGHIAIAVALKEAHRLDHVFFVPAYINPQKQNKQSASSLDRLKMLQLALRSVPDCSILTLELERMGPSYMIDTLRTMKAQKKFKDSQLFLLCGEDLLQKFSQWKLPQEIIELAPPLIAKRSGTILPRNWGRGKDSALEEALLHGMTDTPLFDVSATEIRQRLKRGQYCGHLLNQAVYRYIIQQKLYDNS